MAKTSERVNRMMENFVFDWKEGKNISDIALSYRVTPSTIYKRLQEIADENGIDRKELLERPHKQHEKAENGNNHKLKNETSIEGIEKVIDELIEKTNLLMNQIIEVLEEQEENYEHKEV